MGSPTSSNADEVGYFLCINIPIPSHAIFIPSDVNKNISDIFLKTSEMFFYLLVCASRAFVSCKFASEVRAFLVVRG